MEPSVLEQLINRTFVSERHGKRIEVVLKDVRARKVVVQERDRTDSFKIDIARFNKKFVLVGNPAKEETVA